MIDIKILIIFFIFIFIIIKFKNNSCHNIKESFDKLSIVLDTNFEKEESKKLSNILFVISLLMNIISLINEWLYSLSKPIIFFEKLKYS